MILATKSALRTGVEVKVLHIRERVAHRVRVWCAGAALLGYFYNACTQIAKQSALLAGFCYSGLTYLTYVDGDICERTCAELIFPLAVITAMGFAMLALWQATLASMFAPGLALRGRPAPLFVFLITAMLWSWTWDSWLTSATGTIVILVTMRMIYVTIVSDFTPEFDFQNKVTGGWAPPIDSGARSGGSQNGQRLNANGAIGQPAPNGAWDSGPPPRRSRRAEPWFFRNPVLRYLFRPMYLPAPMTLY
ncbi:hypothetical protein T492DRAFT_996334 [Pavlovales sp. CCMP2436]|nr:hypothetical protein T492DRAFT_996334 [Pavlovales sp. CCMP2436]